MPNNPKRCICFFACHFTNETIPKYLQVYLKELSQFTSKIILLNSDAVYIKNSTSFLVDNNIIPITLPNLGHDFGSWMRALELISHNEYEQYIFANDSCLLTQPLKPFFTWLEHTNNDFMGMINSNERKYHLQSYFTVCNSKGLSIVSANFKKYGIVLNKRKLIKTYEVGISQAQLKAKNTVGSYVEIPDSNKSNPLFHQALGLIESQFPLVKKQLVFNQLSANDITAMKGAGIYTGPEVIKNAIREKSAFKKVDWESIFKDLPINN